MKWITRERVKVDRVACPWLIRKFVDNQAEFLFVPADKVMDEAQHLRATPFDVKGVELGHHGKECSFEAILKRYNLTDDPALVLLGKIVNGADTDNTLWNQPESAGLEAIAEGLAVPFFVVRYEAMIGSFLGETAGRLRRVFDYARTTPCVLFFDEFDTLGRGLIDHASEIIRGRVE